MTKRPALIPVALWEQIPVPVRVVLEAIVEGQARQIGALEAQVVTLQKHVRVLRERLQQTSQNSSKPPSADGPHVKRPPPKTPSGRKVGGQLGHPGHRRVLVPVEEVAVVVDCPPRHCRRCWQALDGEVREPVRHQVVELPPLTPHITEYRLQRRGCRRCGITTCGRLPVGVPAHGYGPRLTGFVALCSGSYRLSKRKIASVCRDVLGIPLSVGEVCQLEHVVTQAVRPVVQQMQLYLQTQNLNMDETPWREQGRRRWLWTASSVHGSLFRIAPTRGARVVRELVGPTYAGVVTSDRAKAYDRYPVHRRQLCWAHVRRDFQAMIDRGGAAKVTGQRLLEHSNQLFHVWHRWRQGHLTRSTLQSHFRQLRPLLQRELHTGAHRRCAKTAATCLELLGREPALWTFATRDGVEPTNNRAERSVRQAVLWRKSSGGTASPRGSRFVEAILTVVTSCQQQGRNALAYLTACCHAWATKGRVPPLVPRMTGA